MRRCVFIVGVVILAVGSSSLAHAANEYATFASFYKQDPSSFIIIIGAVVAAAIAAAAILLTGGTEALSFWRWALLSGTCWDMLVRWRQMWDWRYLGVGR